jgi:hypothetical protein
MSRRSIDTCLSAWYAKRFPLHNPKKNFSDELLALGDMLMAQIDPDGTKPLRYPPMAAEGGESDNRVRTSHRGGEHAD